MSFLGLFIIIIYFLDIGLFSIERGGDVDLDRPRVREVQGDVGIRETINRIHYMRKIFSVKNCLCLIMGSWKE